MVVIDVNPHNLASVEKAKRELIRKKKQAEELPGKIVKALTERLNELIAEYAPTPMLGLWQMDVDEAAGTGWITVDGRAQFFEFGTGVEGLRNHSGINSEWLQNLPPPYNKGWNTGPSIIHTQSGDDYWVYRDATGWQRTSGIPADPFLYRAVQQLKKEYVGIAKAVARDNGF